MERKMLDGNTACASVAYKVNEFAPIYPITPSTGMAEICDVWVNKGEKNVFGSALKLVEMQSEAGAAGALHGALKSGALSTTFTSSQGLLLMIPNMYKIAGEMLPCVMNVSARAIATHALSIFGDHSDVYATRSTGFNYLCSTNPQEAQDFTLIATIASLKLSLPFMHFFDGFRTSHELNEVEILEMDTIKNMLPYDKINAFKARKMTSVNPTLSGTSQTSDVFFQNTESRNKFYDAVPQIVLDIMQEFGEKTGRKYKPYEYYGANDAEFVMIIMGSGANVARETIKQLNANGEKLGVLVVRLFRPFNVNMFFDALPKSVKKTAVLDRAKEQVLYQDVCTALIENKKNIDIVGGIYGLGGFDFSPTDVKAVFDNLKADNSINHFSVGINDDLSNLSLKRDENFRIEDDNYKCVFFGLGGDGTISANKSSAKIIGEKANKFCQAYFVYDSKKSGSTTISHLRFGDSPIHSSYLISDANFLAVHNFKHVGELNILKYLDNNGKLLINFPYNSNLLGNYFTHDFVEELKSKNIELYVINADKIAHDLGLKNKINIIMQSAFFTVTNILPLNIAKEEMAKYVEKNYGKFGESVVENNKKAVEFGSQITKINLNELNGTRATEEKVVSDNAFVNEIMKPLTRLEGDNIAVSKFSPDGVMPTGTSEFEKRGIATELPEWNSNKCVQCNMCSLVCPHGAIRPYLFDEGEVDVPCANSFQNKEKQFAMIVSPLDCTGCGNCMNVCPVMGKAITMRPSNEIFEKSNENYQKLQENSEKMQDIDKKVKKMCIKCGISNKCSNVKESQFNQPYLEFSGACAGCGQTSYVKLLTQICGNQLVISNATGCSSIWGGSYPSVPYTKDKDGFGVAWANSLFEDNAEFGYGARMAYNLQRNELINDAKKFVEDYPQFAIVPFIEAWLKDTNNVDLSIDLYKRMRNLKKIIENNTQDKVCSCAGCMERKATAKIMATTNLFKNIDLIVPQIHFIVGGDGWAYDIGYGGLDHVLASGENVNILVLDTEIYSNTGGQASKATPMGATAKFAESGKKTKKKDLFTIASCYEDVYVAKICLSANPQQALTAFKEAINYNGPSLIIAYAPCVGQGVDMSKTPDNEKEAVASGYWQIARRKPKTENEPATLIIDSPVVTKDINDYMKKQTRFKKLCK